MPKVFGASWFLLAVAGGVSSCGESFSGSQPGPPAAGTTADGGGSGGSAGRGSGGASTGGGSGVSTGGSSTGGSSTGGSSTGGSSAGGSSTGGSSAGGSGGSGATGDGGTIDAGPIPCSDASQCPKPSSACRLAACLQNVCSTIALAPGVSPQQERGDCLRLTCTSDGREETFADPTDVDDGNECTTDACNGTVANHVARTGSTCTAGFCNAQGRCVRCLDVTHCGTAAVCMKYECVAGACQLDPAAAGTFCNGFADQCNGAGVCVDCVNSGGCGECCVCDLNNTCIPA